ncbi:MAG TPA: HD domain-containing phosphohydrolase [Planctomycetota bacterium]|nr:HD domain-containing phosphohydrolase [Planctomycetota bacterium]
MTVLTSASAPASLGARTPATLSVRLSEIVSALSYALDITEGQPEGHAVRTCIIGMRLAKEIGLPHESMSALYYALILKDLGCSSNSARVSYLFGAHDRDVKRDVKVTDWTHPIDAIKYLYRNALPGRSTWRRVLRTMDLAIRGSRGAREIQRIRCDRGAEIARMIGLPEETASAILHLDEHWDGSGYPRSLKREEIPQTSRVLCLAQTVEVFCRAYGVPSAVQMARERSGTWFDPSLVQALGDIEKDAVFWDRLQRLDARDQVAALEPPDRILKADGARIDVIAQAFARVIDAKSPWTFRHSERTAAIAYGIGKLLGLDAPTLRDIRLGALLHDIGKLGVSNLILDKQGPLTGPEWYEMRSHPEKTHRMLSRISCFSDVAELAGAHHEKLDGSGYFRGLTVDRLTLAARTIPVADIFEALTADRPYRAGLSKAEVFKIMKPQAGVSISKECFDALDAFLLTIDGLPYTKKEKVTDW